MTSHFYLFKKIKPKTMTKFFQLTASAFDWKISDDKTIKAWGFNNTVPGPVLRAKKGDEIVINVKNDLQQTTEMEVLLNPAADALLMSLSTIIVALNASMLKAKK
jgi:FtsP/CotA-like multicopper oxidase with cupredoxin domain